MGKSIEYHEYGYRHFKVIIMITFVIVYVIYDHLPYSMTI
jgi:hypothetical protein